MPICSIERIFPNFVPEMSNWLCLFIFQWIQSQMPQVDYVSKFCLIFGPNFASIFSVLFLQCFIYYHFLLSCSESNQKCCTIAIFSKKCQILSSLWFSLSSLWSFTLLWPWWWNLSFQCTCFCFSWIRIWRVSFSFISFSTSVHVEK